MNVHGAGLARRGVGAHFETVALTHLERAGLSLVMRNFNCRYGELDLVMLDRDCLVFVEVRYRRASAFGDGADSVSAGKRARLARAAAMFLAAHPRFARHTCRFDVLAVAGDAAAPSLDWRRSAFEIS